MKILNLFVLAILLLFVNQSFAQYYTKGKTPQRIILNLTSTPDISMAVTWRTIAEIKKTEVQIAETTNWIIIDSTARTVDVKSKKYLTDKGFEVFQHSSIMNGLKPNTRYIYRVGGDSIWSEWNHFSTAKPESEPLTFTYFGDIQHDVKKFGSRILREAYRFSPKSDFWLFTGDLVDRAEFDYQWDEFFSAASFIPSVIPSVFVAGNHEYADTIIAGKEEEILAELWRSHITQPEGTIMGIEETVFSFDYQGVRFIVLNGNEKLQEQAQWLDKILANNPNKWTIVAIHQPLYSMSKGRDQKNSRDAFLPLFDKYTVDLVLQGHDHVYARTAKMKDGVVVKSKEKGTVYVTSNSGSDEYTPKSINTKYAIKLGNKSQLFQVISIRKNKLEFKSYTVTGILYDSFKLSK